MDRDVVEFSPNVPVEVALAYGQGKIIDTRMGQRVMFTLVDNRVMFLDLDAAQRINEIQPKPRQPFYVVKNQEGKRGSPIQWRAWLSPNPQLGERPDGTFAVPNQSAASVRPPAAVQAAESKPPTTPNNGNGSTNGHGEGAGDPHLVITDGRPKTRLEDALRAVVDAIQATRDHAKQIGYDMPTFNGDEICRMVNTLMIQNGGAK